MLTILRGSGELSRNTRSSGFQFFPRSDEFRQRLLAVAKACFPAPEQTDNVLSYEHPETSAQALETFAVELGLGEHLPDARKELASRLAAAGEGATLRCLRLRLGLSQTDLATKAGCSQPRIALLEAGGSSVRIDTAEKLATALNVGLEDFVSALKASMRAK